MQIQIIYNTTEPVTGKPEGQLCRPPSHINFLNIKNFLLACIVFYRVLLPEFVYYIVQCV